MPWSDIRGNSVSNVASWCDTPWLPSSMTMSSGASIWSATNWRKAVSPWSPDEDPSPPALELLAVGLDVDAVDRRRGEELFPHADRVVRLHADLEHVSDRMPHVAEV